MSPDALYLVTLLGLVAVYYEFLRPGMVLPGLGGALLALWGASQFHLSSLRSAGFLLLFSSLCAVVGAAFLGRVWLFGTAAAIAFWLGSVSFSDPAVSPITAGTATALFLPTTILLLRLAVLARRKKRLFYTASSL